LALSHLFEYVYYNYLVFFIFTSFNLNIKF
jgi:hypothetical protein